MLITFSGDNGSGKSATAKRVAELLNVPYFHIGAVFRDDAKRRGMTIQEHDVFTASHPELDVAFDKEFYSRLEGVSDGVVDARTGWHFLPDSFKVFLTAPLSVRAQRVSAAPRAQENAMTPAEAAAFLEDRQSVFQKRLLELYGIDVYDASQFDLVIDTSEKSIEDVAQEIIAQL